MDYKIIFMLLASAIGRIHAQYVSAYPECRVPEAERIRCGEVGISIAACERTADPVSLSFCCYDGTQQDFFSPRCFFSSEASLPPVVNPNPPQPPPGFVPPNQGGGSVPVGTQPPSQGPPGFLPPGFPATSFPPDFVFPTFATTTPRTPRQETTTNATAPAQNTTAAVVTFAPTSDLLGNTVPAGAVIPGGGTTETPEVALQNLLISLGIEDPATPSPNNVFVPVPGDINRTVALCTLVKANQLPESIRPTFQVSLDQCDAINTTIPLAQANAFVRQEINRLLIEAGQRPPSTTIGTPPPVSNNLQNLLSVLGNNNNGGGANNAGGLSALLSSLGAGGTTTTTAAPNPLLALLGNGATGGTGGTSSLLQSLLANNNNGGSSGTSGLLSSLLQQGNSNSAGAGSSGTSSLLASLLGSSAGGSSSTGTGTSALLSSLLGNSGGSTGTGTSALLSSLLGNSGGSTGGSSSLTNTLLQSFLQNPGGAGGLTPVRQNNPIGAQLPDFIGTTPAPVYNPLVCNLLFGNDGLLSGITSGSSSISNFLILPFRQNLLRQFGCLNNLLSNPLSLLQGGGLDGLREQLGPLLGLTSSTEDENIGDSASGPLDPSRIPPAILAQCIEERGSLNAQNNCKVGVHVNILTAQECYNIGCIYADNGMCFRCPYVPISAQVNQELQPTCNVPSSDRQSCPGFQTTFVISSIFSQNLGSRAAPASGGAAAAAASALNANPLLGSRSGQLAPNLPTPTPQNTTTAPPLNAPVLRQGIFGNLGGLAGLTGALGGGGGSSTFTNQFLQSDCEGRGCCWEATTSIFNTGSSCFSKVQPSLPDSSVDCISTLTCGETRSAAISRIIGGQTQTSQDRPWQAIIRLQGTNVVRCSGVIICSQWILTAASCLEKIQSITSLLGFALDLSPSALEVFVGTSDPLSPLTTGQVVGVNRVIPYPFYRVTQNVHDIALLQVNSLPISLSVSPVCLPPFATGPIADGVTISVAGYGQASDNVLQASLREITATTYDKTLCRNIYQSSLPTGGVFCAQPTTTGEDTCVGDGGSPAVTFDADTQTYTLVGINFAGSNDCSGSSPMVFVDVAVYREWIRQTTNGCCSVVGVRLG